ncbi:MAG: TIGR04211 family SH3 domain-containing protein [Pseudomonadota bacterium]
MKTDSRQDAALPITKILLLAVSLCVATLSSHVHAQNIQYISDKQYIPVRRGAGNEFRIIHRGLPTGTKLTVSEISDDGEWAQIATDGGTSGWIRAQYLMQEVPAQQRLEEVMRRAEQAGGLTEALQLELAELTSERDELRSTVQQREEQLAVTADELSQLKQISGQAIQLDTDNKRLIVDGENLRSQLDMLEAENQRLEDKVRSEDFMNGALAVLLGVIITLVVPRLWPKRRKSSSWA